VAASFSSLREGDKKDSGGRDEKTTLTQRWCE